ncbi:MAG: DUF2934 domain-containing protein [Methyloglobulus sp.]
MKPDSESRILKSQFTQNPPLLNKNNKLSVKNNSRQQLKPPLFKPLKQQIGNISRQQWISDAAYYKAEARGFIVGYEQTDWLEAEHDYIEMLIDLFLSVFREDGAITITGLQQLAKAIGVHKPERIDSKLALIRAIQTASNNHPCFRAKPSESCQDQDQCQWNAECQKIVAEWRR